MAARKVKPKVAPIEVPQEDWIWGNHRGGGGAPLKDNDGNNVANLKKVIAGEVEVDHSPSPKAKRKPPNFRPDYDDDDNYNAYSNKNNHRDDRDSNRRNNRDRDDDYSNNSNNKGRGRNYAPDEVVYSPAKKTGYGSFTNAANNISDYDREVKMRKELDYQNALKKQIEEKNRIKEKEKAEAERIKAQELEEYLQTQFKGKVPSHLNNKAKGNDTSDERDRRNAAAAAGQNKKNQKNDYDDYDDYGSSNNGGRKNRVPKFREEDEEDNGSVGRGRNQANRQSKFRDDPEEDDYDSRNRGGGRGGNFRNDRNNDRDNDDEDLSARNYNRKHNVGGGSNNRNSYGGGGGAERGGGGNRRRGEDSDPEEDYDQPRRSGGGGAGGAGGGGGAGRRRDEGGVRGSKENMVPLREYDELSKLCDKLMDQQDAMHNEIRAQAALIEELRKKDAKSAVPRGGGALKSGIAARGAAAVAAGAVKEVAPPMSPRGAYAGFNGARSKSVQQQRVAAGGAGGGAAGKKEDKVSAMKRPSSMHTIAARDKQQIVDVPPLGKPKVAFGGAAGGGGGGAAAPVKSLKKTLANAAANSVVKSSGPDRYAKIKTSPTKVAQAQEMNGFARLQINAKGPVVVTHDSEDEGGHRGGGRRDWGNDDEPAGAANRKKGGMKQSMELKGKSEYIRVSTEDDMINGDQLDRLLMQARKARVG